VKALPRWDAPGVVRGFASGTPNANLMALVRAEAQRKPGLVVLDLGCGAGRNAVPMSALGARVVATDLSWPMLRAGRERARAEVQWIAAPMESLPLRDESVDLVVAHGIWNLAPSSAVFRAAVREAARVARPGAPLFVFTFSRNTFGPEARPLPGEPFVFDLFAGEPQCFLTEQQLRDELAAAGFMAPDGIAEYNRPLPGSLAAAGGPVVYEGTFERRQGESA
jgi:ubiquinone/menaquinone biosynthesis C-methylase UbiE